jgi:hypothetical protein
MSSTLFTPRRIFVLGFLALASTALAATGCDDDYGYRRRCSGTVVTRCRSVCDYWCDGWGCYPSCYDQCWEECYPSSDPPPPPTVAEPPPSSPPPSSSTDAGGDAAAATPSGNGLCAGCNSNADCESGALCILRGGGAGGGGDAGAKGFCGHACFGPPDCPQGFACTQIGSTKQCLPTSQSCP